MGLAIKGKKVIGLALNGKKLLGEAKNGKVIWRFFVVSKLWESNQSGTLQNIQMDDKGLVYVIDNANINRIGKNDGSVYATKNDTSGYIGDLTFNPLQGYVNYVSKTAYWNALNYSNIQMVYDGQNPHASVISDVIQSNYKLSSYKVTLVAYNTGFIDAINNSNTGNNYPMNHNYQPSSSANYLFALDNMGTNSTFTAGDFIAYGSSNVNAFRANSSSSVLTLSGDSDIFKGNGKVTISPIGTDDTEDFYLLQTSAYNKLFSVSKNSSTINVKYLTHFAPLSTNSKVVALAIDYDNYGKSIKSNAISLDGTGSASSKANLPSRFVAYDSELGTDGQEHVYALNYNSSGNSDWKKASHEKLIDIDKDWSVSRMIKKGDNLYIGENYSSIPWKFTADSIVHSVAVDSSGNVYDGTDDGSVYKLDANGKQVWKFTADSVAYSVAVDSSGSVYASTADNSVYKLDANGKQVWNFNAASSIYSVAVDSGGNVYAGTGHYCVYKLDASGKQVWKFTINGSVNSVAVDSGGNVYAGTGHYCVYKLDASGKQVWKFTADHSVNSVAVDSSGNVYAGTNDNFVYKLDASGNQVWKFTTIGGVNSVAVDSSGNVYAGTHGSSVYKLDASGQQVWKFITDDAVNSVAVDSSGNVYAGTRVSSVYKLTPDGSNTTTYNQYKVEKYQIGEFVLGSLTDAISKSTNDSGGNVLYPNSVAVSASNFATATPPNSGNQGNLLYSANIDGNTYISQMNTTGTQQVKGIPYVNDGLYVLENGKLSYRSYSSMGTVQQYLSNSGISGSDPMGVTYIDNTDTSGNSIGSDGTLYWQTSNGSNGTSSALGLTNNAGSFANTNLLKNQILYFINPTTKSILEFPYNGASVIKNNFVDSNDTTSNIITVNKNGNLMYGTKNVSGGKFYVTTPFGSDFKLISSSTMNSGWYLLDISSDNLGHFVTLSYSSADQHCYLSWYDSNGNYIGSSITLGATFSSMPQGHLSIDPVNNNFGIITGNLYSMWYFDKGGGVTASLPQLDHGTNMLSDTDNFIIFDTNNNSGNAPSAGSTAKSYDGSAKVYINSRIMDHDISETLTGVEITLSGKSYDWYNNSWYTGANYSLTDGSKLTIKLSKSSPTYTGKYLGNNNLSGSITFSISGNTLSVKGMINPGTSDEYIPEIASVTAY